MSRWRLPRRILCLSLAMVLCLIALGQPLGFGGFASEPETDGSALSGTQDPEGNGGGEQIGSNAEEEPREPEEGGESQPSGEEEEEEEEQDGAQEDQEDENPSGEPDEKEQDGGSEDGDSQDGDGSTDDEDEKLPELEEEEVPPTLPDGLFNDPPLEQFLVFVLPSRQFPSGGAFSPLEGVVVLDETGADVTGDAQLAVTGNGGCNFDDPEAGSYTLELAAYHPETGEAFFESYPLTVFAFGGSARVSLAYVTDISIGDTSYISLTVNPDVGVSQGRYVLVHAPQGYGLSFNLKAMGSVGAVESMELRDNGQTLLLTLTQEAQSLFTMEFPLTQTINATVSQKLTDGMSFPFSAGLYAGLDAPPEDGEEPLKSDSLQVRLADYPVTSLGVYWTERDGYHIQGYDTAVVRDTTQRIDKVELSIYKDAGMRSSYNLELVVPVNSALVPAQSDQYRIETLADGTPCFVVPATSDVARYVVMTMLDPNASYSSATSAFSFTPAFSNLAGLNRGVTYTAGHSIALRIHQYGASYDQPLGYFYSLERDGDVAYLKYDTLPGEVLAGATGIPVEFRPRYDQFSEPVHSNLTLEVSFPHNSIFPKSIEMGGQYGGASIAYYIVEKKDGLNINNDKVYRGTATLSESGSHTFDIPAGYRLAVLELTCDLDTYNNGEAFPHFILHSDFVDNANYNGNGKTNIYIKFRSDVSNWASSTMTYHYFQLRSNDFDWSLSKHLLDQYIGMQKDQLNSARNVYSYYLEDLPADARPVSSFHYYYDQYIGPQTFTLRIDSNSVRSREYLMGLTGIVLEPSRSSDDARVLESAVVAYTTAQTSPAPVTVSDTGAYPVNFVFAGEDDYLTSLTITFTTQEWTRYTSYPTLIQFKMDLNRYTGLLGKLFPDTDEGGLLRYDYTLTNSTSAQVQTGVGYAGVFYDRRTPHWLAGSNLRVAVEPLADSGGSLGRVADSQQAVQAGGTIQVSVSRFLTTHSTDNSSYQSGNRVGMEQVTTYIPIHRSFTYVKDSADFYIANQQDYEGGQVVMGSVNFVPAAGSEPGWLAVNWTRITTGSLSSSVCYDDPVITFRLRASPLAGGVATVLPGRVYSDVERAMELNPRYELGVASGENGAGTHAFDGEPRLYRQLTSGSSGSTVRILTAVTYEIELYGGLDQGFFDKTAEYRDQDTVYGVVQMAYDALYGGGADDGVVYLPIPQVTGAHKGLQLAGLVDVSDLPGGTVAYATKENPEMAMLSNWDAADTDFSTTPPANLSQVTAVRIIGYNLDETLRFAYIPLKNAAPKEQVGDQTISLSAHARYAGNRYAVKSVNTRFSLTDYTVSGSFWLDQPQNGQMSGKPRIGGFVTAQSASRTYPTGTVDAGSGYTLRIPTHGSYTLHAFSPGYVLTDQSADSPFDPADGTCQLDFTSGTTRTVHAGFVPDGEQSVLVLFHSNGGDEVLPQRRLLNQLVSDPGIPTTDPVKAEKFIAWYEGNSDGSVQGGAEPWNFHSDRVTQAHVDAGVLHIAADWNLDPEILVENIHYGFNTVPLQKELFSRVTPDPLSVTVVNPPAGNWTLTVSGLIPFTLVREDDSLDPDYTINENALFYQVAGEEPVYLDPEGGGAVIHSGSYAGDTFYREWGEDEGILCEIGPNDMHRDGAYRAYLVWDLSRGPVGAG